MDIKKYFEGKVKFDSLGGCFFDEKSNMIAQIRGWGRIQYLFKNEDGSVDFQKAGKFQDEIGEWIADAINQKLKSI